MRAVKRGRCPHAQCFPPSHLSPAVSSVLPAPSISTAASSPLSLCPASRTQPQLPTAVRTVPGYAVHRPAVPQAEDCRLHRQSSAAASSLIRSLAAKSVLLYMLYSLLFRYSMQSLPHYFLTFSLYILKKNKNPCKGSPSYGVSKGQAAEAVRCAEP